MAIVIAFLIVGGLGLILGIGLAVADKKLHVEKDEKLIELEEAMPGANCGGCGYAGCQAYAEAVFKGEAAPGLCSPGGNALAEVAFVFCRGNRDTTKTEFVYSGIQDCNAASLLQGGPSACKEGCLHLGSCISVCPAGAISKTEDGNIVVDKEKCIGCGKCTTVCPNNVIKMVPYSAEYIVACNNHQNGAQVRKACQVGCIGCRICQVKVEGSPFKVENFLSVNDYSVPQDKAAEAAGLCPQKCIIRRS